MTEMTEMTELTKDKDTPLYRRVLLVTGFILTAFFIIVLRLTFLQIIQGEKHQLLSMNNRIRLARIKSPRGIIYDRNRYILTATRPSYLATIVTEDIKNLDQELNFLTQILNIPIEKLNEKINVSYNRPYKSIVLKKDLSFAEVSVLEEYKQDLPGVNVEVEAVRSYPENELAAHILGYMGEISETQLRNSTYQNVHMGDQIGQFGLEKIFNVHLTGQDGGKQIEVDATGREMETLGLKEPTPGNNLVLTIDVRLQRFIEELLADRSGSVVAINPRNGEILAMVSRPAFNPNSFAGGISLKEWSVLTKNPKKPLQNRAIQSHYPPGSIFKIIVALAGLELGAINESSSVNCGGSFNIGKWSFGCWKKGGHGHIYLHEAIVKSCNLFFYQTGNKIGAEAISHYAQLFGLGQKSGVCLQNEEPGLMPSPTWKQKALRTKWYPGETISMSIGQGYISVTPLQIASFISAVANNGILYRPKLIRYILNPQGEIVHHFPTEIVRKIDITPQNLKLVQEGLFGVVNEYGTGGRAMIKDIKVAGKTGTAQVISLQDNVEDEDLPEHLRDHAWFCAYAPFEAPELALAILVEHGGKGGAACAPLAKEIFLKYFELKKEEPQPHETKTPMESVDATETTNGTDRAEAAKTAEDAEPAKPAKTAGTTAKSTQTAKKREAPGMATTAKLPGKAGAAETRASSGAAQKVRTSGSTIIEKQQIKEIKDRSKKP